MSAIEAIIATAPVNTTPHSRREIVAGREPPIEKAQNPIPAVRNAVYTVPGVVLKNAIGYTYNPAGDLLTIIDPMLGQKLNVTA